VHSQKLLWLVGTHHMVVMLSGAAQANVLPYVLFVVLVVVGVVILLRKRKEVFAANGVSV